MIAIIEIGSVTLYTRKIPDVYKWNSEAPLLIDTAEGAAKWAITFEKQPDGNLYANVKYDSDLVGILKEHGWRPFTGTEHRSHLMN